MTDPDDHQDQDEDRVQQRVVSAAEAEPVRVAAASSAFNWRGAGAPAAAEEKAAPANEFLPPPPPPAPAASTSPFNWRGAGTAAAAAPAPTPAPSPPPPEEEETTMVKKRNGAARARASKRGSPQLAICTVLAAQGDLGREAIAECLPDLTGPQISSALNNSKSQGRIAWIAKDEVFRITAAGKEWVTAAGGAGEAAAAAVDTKPKGRGAAGRRGPHKRQQNRRPEPGVDTSPTEATATFRCGVMSDGSFFVSKEGVAIELDAEEYAAMRSYQDRLATA